MKGNHNLSHQFIARILLISLFLQSCFTSMNLPNQEEGLVVEQVEGRMETVSMEAEKATELGKFEVLPIELLQEILTYVRAEEIKEVRGVNRAFYKLTTGYDQPGLVGVENRPSQYRNTDAWVINEEIDFSKDKLSKLTPETIPSFAFYQLMGQVKNLPKEFWPYLQGTSVHTLDLSNNQIGAAGASQIAQHLQGTKVHTLDLAGNQIGDADASELAQHLKGTSVHTLYLGDNEIGDSGASQIAQHLQGTSVHTLYLGDNEIGAAGASQLAHHLQGTSVHTLDLRWNNISDTTQQLLKEQYPHINWGF
jgi:hypothetical protein